VLPFNNYIVTKRVTGADIKTALELGVKLYPELNGGFPQVSGMTYSFDPSRPAGARIVEVTIGGQPMDDDKTYVLATNDFMAAGGDGYTMFADDAIVNEFPALDEALIAYIKVIGVVSRDVEGRIKVLPRVKYTVQPGDVLWRIAMVYGTTTRDLLDLNNLADPDSLIPGQELILPVQNLLKVDPKATGAYEVQVDDVLWKIAEKYGVTWQVLQQMNGLPNPDLLYVGQRLAVPSK
jgi:LysM repeat protein